jgi:hypothetical protein
MISRRVNTKFTVFPFGVLAANQYKSKIVSKLRLEYFYVRSTLTFIILPPSLIKARNNPMLVSYVVSQSFCIDR